MEKTILQNGTRVISYAPDDESDNLVDALKEFNPKRVKSVTHTEGDITTFAVKADKGYTLKVTGKYNNRTGEFEYV